MIKLGPESWDDAYLQGAGKLEKFKPFASASLFLNDLTDWKDWSEEMENYCRQDVNVTVKLCEHFHPYLSS